MPIIGPNPNINKTNFAEFFVCPNSGFLFGALFLFFLDFLFFMKNILSFQVKFNDQLKD